MFVCPFLILHHVLLVDLILYIVIFGCLLLLASLVLNIIWSYSTIALTMDLSSTF